MGNRSKAIVEERRREARTAYTSGTMDAFEERLFLSRDMKKERGGEELGRAQAFSKLVERKLLAISARRVGVSLSAEIWLKSATHLSFRQSCQATGRKGTFSVLLLPTYVDLG